MDFSPDFIRVVPGCLDKVCEILTQIFHKGPTEGGCGQRRWRIIKGEVNWYAPAGHYPEVVILAFDLEKRDIYNYLKEQKLVA